MKLGYIYEFNNIKDFEIKLEYILNNESEIIEMRKKCLAFSKKFEPCNAIIPLIKFIEE